MKPYPIDNIRNVALVGHGGSGKTTLAEHILHLSGATDRIGSVEAGTTVSDFDQEEVKRKISLSVSVLPVEWEGHKVNLIDVPGFPDFIGDMYGALRVVDSAIIVAPAQADLDVGFENAWEQCEEQGLPRFVFVNKMERDNADYPGLLATLQSLYGRRIVPIQIPVGAQTGFKGVVDLLHMKAYVGHDKEGVATEIPAELVAEATNARDALIEAAAESEDDLAAKYLDGIALTEDEILHGLQMGINAGTLVPLMVGSAGQGIGTRRLLETIIEFAPSPTHHRAIVAKDKNGQEVELAPDPNGPLCAFVFKTTADPYVGKLTYFRVFSGTFHGDSTVYNSRKERDERIGQVYYIRGKNQAATPGIPAGDIAATAKLQETSTGDTLGDKAKPLSLEPVQFPDPIYQIAIAAKSKADEDKMGPALARLHEEDPTLHVRRDPETHQTLLLGMGDLHLDIVMEKLKRKFSAEVVSEEFRIPFRETVVGSAKAQGKFKRQSGGRGQYGDCWIELDALPRGSGIEFGEKIVGGSIPKNYIPSIEKGIRETAEKGLIAGYPLVDFKAVVYDGSYHDVDSSDAAFRMAGNMALKAASEKTGVVMLEPELEVEISVPDAYTGDVMGDMNGRRGRILGMEPAGKGRQTVRAIVPMAEMLKYALELRSITRGRGRFKTKLAGYTEMPHNVAAPLIEKAKKEREAQQDH